jgi:beta-galactosidase/beta-glucuronidase
LTEEKNEKSLKCLVQHFEMNWMGKMWAEMDDRDLDGEREEKGMGLLTKCFFKKEKKRLLVRDAGDRIGEEEEEADLERAIGLGLVAQDELDLPCK